MNEGFQNLTLIIPTFNRSEHLNRLITYYASKNTNLSFLILDSSASEIASLNQKISATLGKNARHILFPSSKHVAEKLSEGFEYVDTPYSVICGDDDLIFIDALAQSLKYLQDHPDYSSVDGIYFTFLPQNNNITINLEYYSRGIDANNPLARVFKLYQKYESLFYCVCKTSQMKLVFSSVKNVATNHYIELFQSAALLLLGKKHRLPIFYGARQSCEFAEPHRDRWQSYEWFSENSSEFIAYYVPYRKELWRFYKQNIDHAPLREEEFNQVMDVAHAVFFSTNCSAQFLYNKLQIFWPDDPFQKFDCQTDVCHPLKKLPSRLWDVYGERFLWFIKVRLIDLFSQFSVSSLNRKTKKLTNTNWNCSFHRPQKWLSKVGGFRQAYHELCLYLRN